MSPLSVLITDKRWHIVMLGSLPGITAHLKARVFFFCALSTMELSGHYNKHVVMIWSCCVGLRCLCVSEAGLGFPGGLELPSHTPATHLISSSQLKYPCSARLLLPVCLWLHQGGRSSLFDNHCVCVPPLTLPWFSTTSPVRITSEPRLHKTPSLPPLVTSLDYALDLQCLSPPPASPLLPYHRWAELRYCTS